MQIGICFISDSPQKLTEDSIPQPQCGADNERVSCKRWWDISPSDTDLPFSALYPSSSSSVCPFFKLTPEDVLCSGWKTASAEIRRTSTLDLRGISDMMLDVCHRQYITLMEWQQPGKMCHKMSASAEGLNGNEEAEGGTTEEDRETASSAVCLCVAPHSTVCTDNQIYFLGRNRSDPSSLLYQMAAVHFICWWHLLSFPQPFFISSRAPHILQIKKNNRDFLSCSK